MSEVQSNSSLIKSNSFTHIFDINSEKMSQSLGKKNSIGINCKSSQNILKPKIIEANIHNLNNFESLYENKKKIFAKKLKLIFKYDIPIFSDSHIKINNIKYIKSNRNKIFKGNFNWLINSLAYKRLEEKNNISDIFKEEIKENIFPKIIREKEKIINKEKNINKEKGKHKFNNDIIRHRLEKSENNKNLRVISGILNRGKLYSKPKNKFKVNSFSSNSAKNQSLIDDEKENKLSNQSNLLNQINIYNLKDENKSFKMRFNKREKFNNLYKKYSSVDLFHNLSNFSDNLNINNTKDINDTNKIDNEQNRKIFVSKLKDKEISHISNKYNNILLNIKNKNNKIIDINNKIFINCLLSKVEGKLKREKIIFEKNKKTLYEMEKDTSYRRIKKFENIINKLCKEKD